MIFAATMWDDALVSDLKLIEILKKYNATANFAIAPARHGNFRKSNDPRGDYGSIVALNELKEFTDFEISNHTANHVDLTCLPKLEALKEIEDGKKILEDIFDREIDGFCYPYGKYNQEIVNLLQQNNYKYARTTEMGLPFQNILKISPTCKWNTDVFDELFKLSELYNRDLIFWGHTYEIKNDKDWNVVEKLYERLKLDPKIKLVTFKELAERHKFESISRISLC